VTAQDTDDFLYRQSLPDMPVAPGHRLGGEEGVDDGLLGGFDGGLARGLSR